MSDLINDVSQVEKKVTALARRWLSRHTRDGRLTAPVRWAKY
jgi:hypothetical protein